MRSPFSHSYLYLQIQESEHIKVENGESGSKLTILAARQEHCGCYTLVVENKLGSRQAQVNLTVVGESSEEWRAKCTNPRTSAPSSLLPSSPAFSAPYSHAIPCQLMQDSIHTCLCFTITPSIFHSLSPLLVSPYSWPLEITSPPPGPPGGLFTSSGSCPPLSDSLCVSVRFSIAALKHHDQGSLEKAGLIWD